MTLAHLDPDSGVSGDMLLGALLDAGLPLDELQEALDALGLPGLRVTATQELRAGTQATAAHVTAPPQSSQRHLTQILALIEESGLPPAVTSGAARTFTRLAEAEARVHHVPITEVHFHEVGAADALADVVGTVFGLHRLGVDRLTVGPVNVGSGTVRCAHGTLGVPAPATRELLAPWITFSAGPERELTTPTGAALATSLGTQVPCRPPMTVERVGIGAGGADPAGWPNVLRLTLGRP